MTYTEIITKYPPTKTEEQMQHNLKYLPAIQEHREGGGATRVIHHIDPERCAEFGRRCEALARNGLWLDMHRAVDDFASENTPSPLTPDSSVHDLPIASELAQALDTAGYLTVRSLIGLSEMEVWQIWGVGRDGAAAILRAIRKV